MVEGASSPPPSLPPSPFSPPLSPAPPLSSSPTAVLTAVLVVHVSVFCSVSRSLPLEDGVREAPARDSQRASYSANLDCATCSLRSVWGVWNNGDEPLRLRPPSSSFAPPSSPSSPLSAAPLPAARSFCSSSSHRRKRANASRIAIAGEEAGEVKRGLFPWLFRMLPPTSATPLMLRMLLRGRGVRRRRTR
jgi:hypothetical protein